MTQAAEIGAVIFPPLPAFYARPRTLDDIINFTVGRVLARLGIDNDLFVQWTGLRQELDAQQQPARDPGPDDE